MANNQTGFLGVFLVSILVLFSAPALATPEPPEEGFRSIFNGKDLSGWEGDLAHWAVKDGVIVGTTTAEAPLPYNKFLIWRGGKTRDFELRLKGRVIGNSNSGIQYRSRERKDLGEWVVSGYQADMHPSQKNIGMVYEEKGRGIIVQRGQKVVITPEGKKMLVGTVGETGPELTLSEWNEYTIIARGNHVIQKINGQVTCEFYDHEESKRSLEGILALQIHRGPPMKAEFKDIRIRDFSPRKVTPPEKTPIPADAKEVFPARKPGAKKKKKK